MTAPSSLLNTEATGGFFDRSCHVFSYVALPPWLQGIALWRGAVAKAADVRAVAKGSSYVRAKTT